MNKYTKPEIAIVKFEVCDIIATSSLDTPEVLNTWGSMVQSIDAVDLFK